MPRSDDVAEALYGDHAGQTRPYLPGLALFCGDVLEAERDQTGVWIVTFPEDADDRS